jgi:hypothetical protein
VPNSQAAATAGRVLAGMPKRLAHSRLVAQRATDASRVLSGSWATALEAAGWLHDIGYSAELAVTGFHPLDGARWLRKEGWSSEVCRLVAWHTGALNEADLLGLDHELRTEFEAPPALPLSVLTWADLTSSPDGSPCTSEWRLAEILSRYPEDFVVHRAISAGIADLRSAVREIEGLLAFEG